ncbi:hypothetical protein HHL17_05585 [Chitinophaga sp. G-6-1-13]|uniref:Cytochrome c domain-containing protein n=1 Tax=Chitinophaga fulva TaxID=2728842 RepID=A0A848GDV6_9BACT|nr:hypothetical protein [Chitinophaga fulva]NML36664.1 hypothetical protein [Chitinophaga fulva]
MKKKTHLLLAGVILLAACKNEQAPAPVIPNEGLDCKVARIVTTYVYQAMQVNCTSRGCHTGNIPRGRADFSTPDNLKAYITASRAVFIQRVTSAQADMPPSRFPALSKGMKDSIACWIERGMPDQ